MAPSTRCWLAMNSGRRPRGLLVEGEGAAGIGLVEIEMEVKGTAEQEVVWGRGAGIGIGSGEGRAAAVGTETGTGGGIMIVIGADALFMIVKVPSSACTLCGEGFVLSSRGLSHEIQFGRQSMHECCVCALGLPGGGGGTM